MTARGLAALLAVSVLSSSAAIAGPAPVQLRGKSISVSWSERGAYRRADGSLVNDTYDLLRIIYVSEAGRAFFRGRTGGNRGMTFEAGPERTAGSVDFRGSTVVVYQVNRGVARRIVLTFDASFASCSGSLTVGKSGPNATMLGHTGMVLEMISITPSALNCTIREGNALAN